MLVSIENRWARLLKLLAVTELGYILGRLFEVFTSNVCSLKKTEFIKI